MKKTLLMPALLLAIASGGLTGCNKTSADFRIGISQFVVAPALNEATAGFIAKVANGMREAGKSVDFDIQRASGDTSIASSIANSFVSQNKDLILANATPCLQTAATSTEDIPILGTSITEFASALGLDHDISEGTGINVSGTSDLAPIDQQVEIMTSVFSDANHFGLLYCTDEDNSIYQIEKVKEELSKKGKTFEDITFQNSSDLSVALEGKIGGIDALYIPTDNSCAENASIIDGICGSHSMRVFAGEEGMCRECGAITLSISYAELGEITGQMALDILLNGADIKTMPIRLVPSEHLKKKYNPEICEELGITPPADFEEIKNNA